LNAKVSITQRVPKSLLIAAKSPAVVCAKA